ncbi:MAG: ANTAR domain-containing response regulator [Actinomycetota bacterium]
MEEPYSTEIVESLTELHDLLLSEETLQSTLDRVVALARAGCDSAGVTIVDDLHASSAAATDDFTLKIDVDQYDNREGPCLQAVISEEVVMIEDIATETRWPSFTQTAARDGLGATLSLPLTAGGKTIGALNLYAKTPRAFGDGDRALGMLMAGQAAVAISNARVYESALKLAEQLTEAIKTREIIGEAKGILMAQEGVSEDEAFDMLTRLSQNTNIKLRDIAQKIVDEAVKKNRAQGT